MMEPRDGAFAFGQLIIGAAGKPDQEEVRNHLRSWLVKGFFIAFMLAIVPSNFADMVHLGAEGLFAGPVEMSRFLISLMFVVDGAFATVGYMLTMKPLDAHIRPTNPYMTGRVEALICYTHFFCINIGG